jgi:hypothetical protein
MGQAFADKRCRPSTSRLNEFIHPLFAALVLAAAGVAANAADSGPAVSFRLDEGLNINHFSREGAVAAHLLLRSGEEPRILVAFPAGNSGVGLWFTKADKPIKWTLVGSPRAITLSDAKGRPLRGIEAEAEVDAPALHIDRAVLSSIRVLRDFERLHSAPDVVMTAPALSGARLSWTRDRLDGEAGYLLAIEALGNASVSANAISSDSGTSIRLKLTALTGEQPLTPLAGSSLLTARASSDTRSRNVLRFLSYREKYLAGSWRFDTYFGRDTLMSLSLLAPALQSDAIGSGIGSVLQRLAPDGEVAHEEDIGEFAVLRNMREGRGLTDTPIYDYGMVDDDFMLAPVTARWLLAAGMRRSDALAFLATRRTSGTMTGDALVRNFEWVVNRTAGFSSDPVPTKLIGIKAGRNTGNWRDSEDGLGRGIYPYDINVALVPAALDAIDGLMRSGLLDSYMSEQQRHVLSRAAQQRDVWSLKAAGFFRLSVPGDTARAAISAYAARAEVDPVDALASAGSGPIEFNAVSLDEQAKPIPVMHSDDGFTLLFGQPTPERLERAIETLSRPFPAGLLTPVGMLVANPAFADAELQERFSSTAYHGTVVWSWQQALMAAGLERQLARTDLPAALRSRLREARSRLWSAIAAAGELRSSELWSWSFAGGCYRAEPFGARRTDVDESNAAQLWSTVFLAVTPPKSVGARAIAESGTCVSRGSHR